MRDWLGSGAISIRETAERIITECLRRVKLLVKNDPITFPPINDVSANLATQLYVLVPVDASGTPLNVPWSVVRRDGAGGFAAGQIRANIKVKGGTPSAGSITNYPAYGLAIQIDTGGTYDFALLAPGGGGLIVVPTGTSDLVFPGGKIIHTGGSFQTTHEFGCNGATPQASYAAGPAASAAGTNVSPYGFPTLADYDNLLLVHNQMLAALRANGTMS